MTINSCKVLISLCKDFNFLLHSDCTSITLLLFNINLYHTFIYPYLLCGSVVQCQMCPPIPYYALTEPLLLQLHILPIHKLIQSELGCLCTKCIMACIHLLITICMLVMIEISNRDDSC